MVRVRPSLAFEISRSCTKKMEKVWREKKKEIMTKSSNDISARVLTFSTEMAQFNSPFGFFYHVNVSDNSSYCTFSNSKIYARVILRPFLPTT